MNCKGIVSAVMASSLMFFSSLPSMAKPSGDIKLSKDNIDEVLQQMTLKEKASVVVGTGWGSMMGMGLLSSEPIKVPGAAGSTRAVKRLGIPSITVSDGPAGVRLKPKRRGTDKTYYCTGFPVGTLLACSWDEDLVEEIGRTMGNEVLEYGIDVILGPGMNLHRNPLCGRNFEYYSEDPLLTGKTAAAVIRGIQSNGVGTSAKHFAANSQETNRNNNDARVSERALRELCLRGFEIAVKESFPWTIMSSYNRINGVYTQEDPWLLTKVLRDDWGYDGVVMTDWTSKRNTAAQIYAGNDLMEPGFGSQVRDLVKKVKKGELEEKYLDICVRRILSLIVKTPTFNGYKYSDNPDLEAHAKVVRRAAAEGMVLLENDSMLPLSGVSTAAVFGVTSYDVIAGGTGSGNVNKPYVVSIPEGLRNAGITPDEELQQKYLNYTSDKKNRKKGYVMVGEAAWQEMPVGREEISRYADRNDFALITIGRQAGEGEDRSVEDDFKLSALEHEMISTICSEFHSRSKKVVVLLNVGGVVETASWKDIPDALLVIWGPGQEAGNSVADVLLGKANPSGKLSMTFPVNYEDHPSSANFPAGVKSNARDMISSMAGKSKNTGRKDIDYTDYAEGINVGYRYFQSNGVEVSYPFGYGLSYTTFEYSDPVVEALETGVRVSVKVTNTGSRPGKEIVQVYVSAPEGGLEKPSFELRSYAKTSELAPSQSEVLTRTIIPAGLFSFDEKAGKWVCADGEYTVYFGASASDFRCQGSFRR